MGLKSANVTAPKVNVNTGDAPVNEIPAEATETVVVAGGNEKVTRKASAPSKSIDDLKAQGEAIFNAMTQEEKAAVGSKSNDIELVRALGGRVLGETKTTVNKQELPGQPQVFGFELKANADTKIYRFSDPSKGYREELVKKGSTVQVTSEEGAYLASQPEFGGVFSNAVIFVRGTSKGYTGTLKLAQGSLREGGRLVEIDVKNEAGKYECLPEYKETFGFMYTPRKSERPGAAKGTTVDAAQNLTNTAFGFANYLKQKKGFGA